MDDTTSTNAATEHPASDDQELAKVLAGVDAEAKNIDGSSTEPTSTGLHFEDTPAAPAADDKPADSAGAGDNSTAAPAADPVAPSVAPTITPLGDSAAATAPTTTASPELEAIKKDVITELKPLVSKLDLPADEKFNTILLIIRSTDDQSLIGPAHDAAKAIEDESKRAQALLDVIKEIDFFANQGK